MVYKLKRLRTIGLIVTKRNNSGRAAVSPDFKYHELGNNKFVLRMRTLCIVLAAGAGTRSDTYYYIIHYNKYVLLRLAVQRRRNVIIL